MPPLNHIYMEISYSLVIGNKNTFLKPPNTYDSMTLFHGAMDKKCHCRKYSTRYQNYLFYFFHQSISYQRKGVSKFIIYRYYHMRDLGIGRVGRDVQPNVKWQKTFNILQ